MTPIAAATPTQIRLAQEHSDRRKRFFRVMPRIAIADHAAIAPPLPFDIVAEVIASGAIEVADAPTEPTPKVSFETAARLGSPQRIRLIQAIVAAEFNISRKELLSHRRDRAIVFPRQVAMYVAKELTLRSLPELGRRFGGMDHTTVLHASRKIELLLAEDAPGLRAKIDKIKSQVLATVAAQSAPASVPSSEAEQPNSGEGDTSNGGSGKAE